MSLFRFSLITALLISTASFADADTDTDDPKQTVTIALPSHNLPASIGANIIQTAYTKLGITVEFIEMPIKRSVKQANDGTVDGEVNRIWAIVDSFPHLVRVPTAINYIEQVVYSAIHTAPISSCADLSEYTVGILRGVKHSEICASHAAKSMVYDNNPEMMKVLSSGRLDFAISSRVDGLWFQGSEQYSNISVVEPPLKKTLLYHYLHKKNAHLVPQLDAVFIEMKNSGELQRIRQQTIENLAYPSQ